MTHFVSEPRPATNDPADYVNLADYEARRQTIYTSAPITKDAVGEGLANICAVLRAKPDMLLSDAIDEGVPNVDMGTRYVSKYELRQVIGRRLASSASWLNKLEQEATPAATAERALKVFELGAALADDGVLPPARDLVAA